MTLQTFLSVLVKKICHKYIRFWQHKREKDICSPRIGELYSFSVHVLQYCGRKIFERAPKGPGGLLSQPPFSKAGPTLGICLSKTLQRGSATSP